MKILADKNIYKLNNLIPKIAELTTFDPNDGLPNIDGYDALFVRTVTKLNSSSVPNIPSSLRFIGSASSGLDHIDVEYFQNHGVFVEGAKGCNANAVAEYVITSVLLWANKRKIDLHTVTVGVIGVGAVGSEVQRVLKRFGINYKLYDPPRALRDQNFKSHRLEEILDCDILTFHVPLTKDGKYPTYHWLDSDILDEHKFSLVINASRGGVINQKDLLQAHKNNTVQDFILDVWENEPDIDTEVCKAAFLATPHIAGYSEQAKIIASQMVIGKCCTLLGVTLLVHHTDYEIKSINNDLNDADFIEILAQITPYLDYDRELRQIIDKEDVATNFNKLRVNRTYRFEFPYLIIPKDIVEAHSAFKKLFIKTH